MIRLLLLLAAAAAMVIATLLYVREPEYTVLPWDEGDDGWESCA